MVKTGRDTVAKAKSICALWTPEFANSWIEEPKRKPAPIRHGTTCSLTYELGASGKLLAVRLLSHAAAPRHHKVLFENDVGSDRSAGVREPLHAHRYPSVLYYIFAAHLQEYSLAGRARAGSWPKKMGKSSF